MKTLLPVLAALGMGLTAAAQNSDAGAAFPCPEASIARYTAFRVVGAIEVDGVLAEPSWKAAPQSPRFVDMISGQPAIHETRAAVLWDDQYLYVAYQVQEPFVHARLKHHNDPIYSDNDVECFIAGPYAYYEFEINAFNTVYEAFFVWQDTLERSGLLGLPEFERSKLVGFNGVGFTNHIRGGRLGNFRHALPGLRTAVHIDGTVNNDTDRDRGWTVELAFPWKSLTWLAGDNRAVPPRDGDVWRMDFSRFNTYKEAPPAKDSGGWVWTRHGVWDSHIPECFAQVRFSTNAVATLGSPGARPPR
jgi:hypothetical protein